MIFQDLFAVIDKLNNKYCDIWEQICNIESPTNCKKGIDEVGGFLIELAKKHGWLVETLELDTAGNPICITTNPDAAAEPFVFKKLFIQHIFYKGSDRR